MTSRLLSVALGHASPPLGPFGLSAFPSSALDLRTPPYFQSSRLRQSLLTATTMTQPPWTLDTWQPAMRLWTWRGRPKTGETWAHPQLPPLALNQGRELE